MNEFQRRLVQALESIDQKLGKLIELQANPVVDDGEADPRSNERCPHCGGSKVGRALNDKGQWDGWTFTCKSCDLDF